jgi:hypothetical protein
MKDMAIVVGAACLIGAFYLHPQTRRQWAISAGLFSVALLVYFFVIR